MTGTRAAIAAAVLVLASGVGCGYRGPAPVDDRSPFRGPVATRPAPAGVGEHAVGGGETLYGIAFRHGLDFRDLASWNRIAPPYTIYPGQRLRLSAPSTRTVVAGGTPQQTETPGVTTAAVLDPVSPGALEVIPLEDPPTALEQPVSVRSSPPAFEQGPVAAADPEPITPQQPVERTPETLPEPIRSDPVVVVAPINTPEVQEPVPAVAPIQGAPSGGRRSVQGIDWSWPTEGRVVRPFSASDAGRKGVDIAGQTGQAVLAAGDGEVVYSGVGLIGYGELIIVKHSPSLLSAYSHNRRRLVAEGDRVRAGQQIAEMGRSGVDRDMLHFEIRRNGQPVNPLDYLPRR